MISREMEEMKMDKVGVGRKLEAPTYLKVNAYTLRPSYQQVLSLLVFVTVLALHSIFVVPAILKSASLILWALFGCTYLLLIIIAYDYCYLTCMDPVDRLLLSTENDLEVGSKRRIKQCWQCGRVKQSSYHCQTCRRCVEKFDHHCKYLNNCIGGNNYSNFIRILLTITLFSLTIIGQAIWAFIQASRSEQHNSTILSRWGALGCAFFSLVMLVVIILLLCFHCYLVFWVKASTLQYMRGVENVECGTSEERIKGVETATS